MILVMRNESLAYLVKVESLNNERRSDDLTLVSKINLKVSA